MSQLESTESGALNYRLLRIAGEKFGVMPNQLSAEQQRQVDEVAAKELIMEHAVLSSDEARAIVISEQQVDRALTEIKSRYEEENQFEAALDNCDLDEEQLRAALARELKVEAVLDFVSHEIPDVEETEVKLFFYMHQERFSKPERRVARHILITINDEFPENTRQAALERIELIAQRVAKDPRRFADQAVKHSECPTGLNGGVLGEVPKGSLFPALDAKLFKMKPGEISDVIESDIGFHVLFLEDILNPENISFESIKDKLTSQLNERQRSRHQKRWLRTILSA